MRTISKSTLIALFTMVLIWACSDQSNDVLPEVALSQNEVEPMYSAPQSDAGIIPNIIDGLDPGCSEAAIYFNIEGGFMFSSGPLNYNPDDDSFDGSWVPGLNVTVTDDKYVDWSGTTTPGYCLKNLVVIVKGSGGTNVYFYQDGSFLSDKGLAAPINYQDPSSVPYSLMSLTFCWSVEPCEEEKCYGGGETAFGGNSAGEGKAWWFYYDTANGGKQTIWAGQHMDAGKVEYVGGKIIINLEGWGLEDTPEAVKIQGYNELPEKRQPADKFTTYKGMSLEPAVESFTYYVIHLDLLKEVECEKE